MFGSVAAPLRSPLPTSSTKRRQVMGKSTKYAIEHEAPRAKRASRPASPQSQDSDAVPRPALPESGEAAAGQGGGAEEPASVSSPEPSRPARRSTRHDLPRRAPLRA